MTDFLHSQNRESLAIVPTPIHRAERLSNEIGAEIWFKRDDLTHFLASGNKIRKLEYLFHSAKAKGATTIVTCGGIQSNHARATAVICRILGLTPVLFLRGQKPQLPQGNFLLDSLLGAEIHWMTPDQYRQRDHIMDDYRQNHPKGQEVFVIPEGGSNVTGVSGYVQAVLEMNRQIDLDQFEAVFVPVGSGGTYSGLLAGFSLLGRSTPVIGVNVTLDRSPYFPDKCDGLICQWSALNKTSLSYSKSQIHILDDFVGEGYAIPTPEGLKWIADLMRMEGILLDPVYTSKAFAAMARMIRKEGLKRVLFIHTGGGFGNFGFAESLAGQLKSLL